jgi:hypothetical protein
LPSQNTQQLPQLPPQLSPQNPQQLPLLPQNHTTSVLPFIDIVLLLPYFLAFDI